MDNSKSKVCNLFPLLFLIYFSIILAWTVVDSISTRTSFGMFLYSFVMEFASYTAAVGGIAAAFCVLLRKGQGSRGLEIATTVLIAFFFIQIFVSSLGSIILDISLYSSYRNLEMDYPYDWDGLLESLIFIGGTIYFVVATGFGKDVFSRIRNLFDRDDNPDDDNPIKKNEDTDGLNIKNNAASPEFDESKEISRSKDQKLKSDASSENGKGTESF